VPATIGGRRVIGVERQRDRWVAIVEDGEHVVFVEI
jgi:hypothetical protein